MGGGLPARSLTGGRLHGVPVGVGPMGKTPQTRFIADLVPDVRKDGVDAVKLAVQFVIRVGDDMVLLVGGHHEV